MKNWLLPLAIVYGLGAFVHAIFYQVLGEGAPFWMADAYWVGTGISLFGLAQSLESQKKGRFVPVYFAGGVFRMLLGLGAIILPLTLAEDPDFSGKAMQFVAAYLYVLLAETALAVYWIKKL
jgi:hypothetical protein